MIFTFYKAQGHSVGVVVDRGGLYMARDLLAKARPRA